MVTSTTPIYLQGVCPNTVAIYINPAWWVGNCSDSGAVAMEIVSAPGDSYVPNLGNCFNFFNDNPPGWCGPTNNVGSVRSAVYSLGNGHYLYAYQLSIENFDLVEMTVTRLTIPLGGHPLRNGIDPLPSGAFVASNLRLYTNGGCVITTTGEPCPLPYQGIFAFTGPSYPDLIDNPVASVYLSGSQSNPDSITFVAPGTQDNPGNVDNFGYPHGVTWETAVFGFISDMPPRIIQGQFGANDSGIYVPPFHMVVPAALDMVDPVPDLLVRSMTKPNQ